MDKTKVELGASIGGYAKGDVVHVTSEELKVLEAEAERRGLDGVIKAEKPKSTKKKSTKK